VSDKTKSEFKKLGFAGSLPSILVMGVEHYPLPSGAAPGFDINAVQPDEIKDLLDAPVQNTFLDTVTTNAKIIEAFRRGQESK
jgi:hypothetical protein